MVNWPCSSINISIERQLCCLQIIYKSQIQNCSCSQSSPIDRSSCDFSAERHDEAIEVAFVKQHKGDLEDIVCNQISNACTNVDRSEKPRDSSGLDLSGGAEKVQKEIKIDPQTGQPVLEKNTKKSKENEPKTLSKKDKKAKKDKKKTKDKKKVATKTEKKKAKKEGGANIINVDINDPDSMESILAQIQQATQEHQQEFYKNQEEENKKKAKEEL